MILRSRQRRKYETETHSKTEAMAWVVAMGMFLTASGLPGEEQARACYGASDGCPRLR